MKTFGRLTGPTALLGAAMWLVPVIAAAQAPILTVTSEEAPAGQYVVLDLALSQTNGIAGVNLTLKLDNTGVVSFRKFDGINVAVKAPGIASWQKDENLVSATELRVVAYDSSLPPVALGAGTGVALLRVHLAIHPSATPGATARVWLDNGVDSSVTPNIGLTRLSDANGVSITPDVVDGTVTVAAPLFPPVVFDFTEGQLGWEVVQVRETLDFSGNPPMKAVAPGTAIGLRITNPNDTFGYYSSPHGALPAAENDDILLIADWTISSSQTDRVEAPRFRMRLNASDYTVAEMLEIQSSEDHQGGRISPDTTPDDFPLFFVQSPSARNDIGASGYQIAFDVMGFDPLYTGPLGSVAWLHKIEIRGVPLANAAPITPVAGFDYDWTAAGADTLGWFPIIPELAYTIDHESYPNTIVAVVNNGLELRSTNAPTPEGRYGFGIWESPAFTLPSTADGSVYRLNLTVASTTDDPVNTPKLRVRISSVDFQMVRHFEVIRKDIDPSFGPTPAGTEYQVYFGYPSQLNGVPVRVSVDQINDQTTYDRNGAFKLLKTNLEHVPVPDLGNGD